MEGGITFREDGPGLWVVGNMEHGMVRLRWSWSFGGRLGARQGDTLRGAIEDKPGACRLSRVSHVVA